MLLTDGTHLVSDSDIIELHRFALRVGLKPEWFQGHRIPHYDIFGKVAVTVGGIIAIDAFEKESGEAGIEFVSTRELVKRALRATKREVE